MRVRGGARLQAEDLELVAVDDAGLVGVHAVEGLALEDQKFLFHLDNRLVVGGPKLAPPLVFSLVDDVVPVCMLKMMRGKAGGGEGCVGVSVRVRRVKEARARGAASQLASSEVLGVRHVPIGQGG